MKTKIYILKILITLSFSLNAQDFGINTTNPKGVLDVESTNSAIVIPRIAEITDVENPVNGMIAYAVDEQCFKGYAGGAWVDLSTCSAVNPMIPTSFIQESYIKATNTDEFDRFGVSSISDDGNTLVVGAYAEDSNATGINGDQSNNDALFAGAVYVYVRSGGTWVLEAYLKGSNTEAGDSFGTSVSISGDGNTLAVGAISEDSNATGVNGDQTNNSVSGAGAVYIFTRSGSNWTQQAYIKATNPDNDDNFGTKVDLSDDGNNLVVSATGELSNATGVNGNQSDNSSFTNTGAAYVYSRSGGTWTSQAYLKSSVAPTAISFYFGSACVISGDGTTIAISAYGERSNATGINGDDSNSSTSDAGAVWVFKFDGTSWSQQAYIKASNTNFTQHFGISLDLSDNGNILAVGAFGEASNATEIDGNQSNTSAPASGAVYTFLRSGGTSWTQTAYIKAPNTEFLDVFGTEVALSDDGTVLVVTATQEDSSATGINGNMADNSTSDSGAAYLYTRAGSTWAYQSYIKAFNPDNLDLLRFVSLNGDGTTLVLSSIDEDSNATGVGGDQTDNSASISGAAYIYNITY